MFLTINITSPSSSPNATAAITKTETELTAPAGVWFEAGTFSGFSVTEDTNPSNRDPAFHDLYHVWTFDDVGSFDAPLNVPTAFNDRNTAFGKRVCHVFRNPGTYTVTHRAYDTSGNWSETTTTVTVTDPDTVYSGTRTICYDPSSNFTGAPAGSTQVSTAGALTTAIGNLTASGRVLFRRGADLTDFSITLDSPTYDQDLSFGAYGTGNRPILRPATGGTCIDVGQNSLLQHLKVVGLDFRGGWNAVTEVGDMDGEAISSLLRDVSNHSNLVHDCRFTGLRRVALSSLKNHPFMSIISDSMVEGWAIYGVFGDTQVDGTNDVKYAMLGVGIQQSVSACKGSDTGGFNGVQNQQGPFRYGDHRKVLLRSTYMFSNTSWAVGVQPAIRTLTNNQGEASFIWDRAVFEGGTVNALIHGSPGSPGNYLADKCLFVGSADSQALMKMNLGGNTVRNCLFYRPNVALSEGSFQDFIVHDDLAASSTANKAAGSYVYNNTFLHEYTSAIGLTDGAESNFTLYSRTNNVYHEPNAGVTSDAPINIATAISGFVPRYGGRKNSLSRPSVSPGAVANGGTFTVAYPVIQPSSTATGASDYTTGDEIALVSQSSNTKYFSRDGDIAITSLGASNITIQNNSGAPLAAETYWFLIENNVATLDTSKASPSTIPLPRPESGSAAYQTATGSIGREDFLVAERPGTGTNGAPAGSPSRGAIEPV